MKQIISKYAAGLKLAVSLGFIALLVLTSPSAAAGNRVDMSHPAFAAVGTQATSIPVGHAQFCKANPRECVSNRRIVETEHLTEAKWKQLLTVNANKNATIVPVTDRDLYKVEEFWTYPSGYGDCEDIALAKRRTLINQGWDPSSLLMTVVRQPNGDGHAVLMVRTDRGDLILDNLDGLVKLWNETPYRFIKRQAQAHSAKWVDFLDTRAQIASR